jgi:hypothetical protein
VTASCNLIGRGAGPAIPAVLLLSHTCRCSFFFVILFYLLRISRFSVDVWNFLLITLRDTPQSVVLPWTRDRLVAESSTWQQHTNTHKRQTSMPPPPRFFFVLF